jgi:hypothetical protein
MTNNSKYNFPDAQKVQIIEKVDTYIENSNVESEKFESFLTDYRQLIDELQHQNPHITDQASILNTIDSEIRRTDTRWQNFLTLKRLWNGGKKAMIKVGEHFTEENVWGKAAIAFLEGITEDIA